MIRIYLDWLRARHAKAQDEARLEGESNGYITYAFGYEQGRVDALAEAMKHLEEPAQ